MSFLNETQERLVDLMDRRGCRPIVVASHPRSGTHLLIDALRLNFRQCRSWKWIGEVPTCLFVDADRLTTVDAPLGYRAVSRPVRRGTPWPVIKTHATPDFGRIYWAGNQVPFCGRLRDWLRAKAAFIYIYRDVREALASGYVAIQRDPHPSLSEYIREPAEGYPTRILAWCAHVRAWLNDPLATCISMETLLKDPAGVLRGLARRLDLPLALSDPRLPRPRRFHRLSRLTRALSLTVESTAIFDLKWGRRSHDWRNSLTTADRKLIHQQAGDLLVKLGYEPSGEWAGELPDALNDALSNHFELQSCGD